MHSRIYGIARKGDIGEREVIEGVTETELYERMSHIADYVSEETELDDDCEWLRDGCEGVFEFTGKTTFKINKGKLEEYLERKIERLQDLVSRVRDGRGLAKRRCDIKRAVADESGFWVTLGIGYAESFDDFVMDEIIEENDIEYEIVKTWDYHY